MNDEVRLPALQSGGSIRAIVPSTFEEAYRIANAVTKAGMAPRGLDTAEKCTIVILHGLEVGMPPMMALQSIALINGRPTVWGDGVLGLVQSSGKLSTIKEWIEGTGDARTAICRVVRVNDPEPKIGKFSIADAKKAKLWTKAGTWQEYPERMLAMRARSWALRDGFADVLKGLSIAEEQLDVSPRTEPYVPPTPPSLSQPLKPTLGEPPVSSVMRAPTPPKPPSVKATIEEKVVRVEEQPEALEPDEIVTSDGEVITPGQMLSDLDDALEPADSIEEIERIWNDHDIEARLTNVTQGEQFIGVALGIKRRHMKRFEQS